MHINSFQVKSVKDNAFRSLCRSNIVSKQDVIECDASNKNASIGFINRIHRHLDTLGIRIVNNCEYYVGCCEFLIVLVIGIVFVVLVVFA